MNKVILMGRLCKDPEIKGEGQSKVAKYSLAVDRRFSKSDDDKTDFINIVVFGKGAEFSVKYLKKGMKVLVTGRIQTGSYVNKDGVKIYTTDVVAEDQEFCESKGTSSAPTENKQSDGDFMDIPANALSDMPF
jgi:single-strand DNA-binding protein